MSIQYPQFDIKNKRGFGSDNHSGVHPEILNAILHVNTGHLPSYGTDELTIECQKIFQQHFGAQAQTHFVFNGTGANVLSLKILCQSFESVICTDVAHIHVDECAAPEALSQVKLITVPHVNGKLTVESIKKNLIRFGDQHFAQVKAVSLTQPTELGTCYSFDELKEIIGFCKSQNLLVHIDGSRISNASWYLKKSFKEFTTDLGVDIISFGGTKNGLMFGEAVIVLNPQLQKNVKFFRKQLCQLPSKSRYISAQFYQYFKDDLYKKIAQHSCERAFMLYDKIKNISNIKVSFVPQSNAVFVQIPQAWVKRLRETYFFYVWDEFTFECRFMTSWDTQTEDIEGFAYELLKLSQEVKT